MGIIYAIKENNFTQDSDRVKKKFLSNVLFEFDHQNIKLLCIYHLQYKTER